MREHHWHPSRTLRARDVGRFVPAQNIPEHERDGRGRLVAALRGELPFGGQMLEERTDMSCVQFVRVVDLIGMEGEELPHPAEIGLLRSS